MNLYKNPLKVLKLLWIFLKNVKMHWNLLAKGELFSNRDRDSNNKWVTGCPLLRMLEDRSNDNFWQEPASLINTMVSGMCGFFWNILLDFVNLYVILHIYFTFYWNKLLNFYFLIKWKPTLYCLSFVLM